MITILLAVGKNGVIGKNNALPWRIKEDLQHFKKLTYGHNILMGRKTFESLPKLLPHRNHIVITSQIQNVQKKLPLLTFYPTFQQALEDYRNKPLFIIGGAHIFKQAIHHAWVRLAYITKVYDLGEGDVFILPFPNPWYCIYESPLMKQPLASYAPFPLSFRFTTWVCPRPL